MLPSEAHQSLGWKCCRCGGDVTTEGVYLQTQDQFANLGTGMCTVVSKLARFDYALTDPRIQAIIAGRGIQVACATCGRASEVAQDVVEALR